MNEPSPGPPEFKDRRTGLTVFGTFTVLLGGLCALLVPLMVFGQQMAEKTTGVPANNQAIVPGIIMYGGMAVILVWLGIGSIMARRWARALLLIFSWTWLLIGVVSLVFMAVLMPQIMEAMRTVQPSGQPPLPGGILLTIMAVQFAVIGVLFIILPGVWVLFYRNPHVKATCEAQDPRPSWTDACPSQVLALSIWCGLSVPMMMAMPLAYHSVLPCFGIFLTGFRGTLGWLLLAGFWGYAARAIHRLQIAGWWVLLVSTGLMIASNALTFARHEPIEMYRLMGYPEAQIEQLQKFNIFGSTGMVWMSLLFAPPLLGYMLYVKRYFRRPI